MYELNVQAIVSSLNQISSFSSNSQMSIYLEKFGLHGAFSYHMNELELSYNCARRHVKAWGRFVSVVI